MTLAPDVEARVRRQLHVLLAEKLKCIICGAQAVSWFDEVRETDPVCGRDECHDRVCEIKGLPKPRSK